MARRVIYRDNSLVFGNPPNGYKFVGYNGVTFSQLDFTGSVKAIGCCDGGGGGLSGTGTTNYIPKWIGPNTLSSTSNIYDTGTRVGIGTASPIYPFQVYDPLGTFYYNSGLSGVLAGVQGKFVLTQLSAQTAAYLTYSTAVISIGIRAWDDDIFGGQTGYGKKGDSFVYSSANSNGLNIISQVGTSTDDYIRFFAGLDASSAPHMFISGRGSNKGYVGIGTSTPSQKLEVVGGSRFYGDVKVGSTSPSVNDIEVLSGRIYNPTKSLHHDLTTDPPDGIVFLTSENEVVSSGEFSYSSNGSVSGTWIKVGSVVHICGVWNSSSSNQFYLPVQPQGGYSINRLIGVAYRDNGSKECYGVIQSGTNARIYNDGSVIPVGGVNQYYFTLQYVIV